MRKIGTALGGTMLLALAACGGGGGSSGGTSPPPASTPTHAVTGKVSGLSADGLSLSNGTEILTVASGVSAFTFTQPVAEGATYAVTVKTQPTGLNCSVSNGSGTVGTADVSTVNVSCTAPHLLKGTVVGLNTEGLVLTNGADELPVAKGNTAFSFAKRIQEGATYAVAVKVQPAGSGCAVANGSGSMGAVDVENVTVTCKAISYSLGGTVTGLSTTGLKIVDGTTSESLVLAAGQGTFTFPTSRTYGTNYNVSIGEQPAGQNCAISAGQGVVTGDTTSITVNCVAALLPGAENLPSLLAPQLGSIAAVGNGLEGTYIDFFTNATIISSDGTYVRLDLSGLAYGLTSHTTSTWTIKSGTYNFGGGLGIPFNLSGSGTFKPFISITGTDSMGSVDARYGTANALAVAQTDLQGRWVTRDSTVDLTLDQTGVLTGTTSGNVLGVCNLTGTIVAADTGSKKNMFKTTLNVSGGSSCKASGATSFAGLAYVDLYPLTTTAANGYKRMLVIGVAKPDGAWLYMTPRKQ